MNESRTTADQYNRENRERILIKFNNECVECKSTEQLQLDHIKPISLGGISEESNIQVLCKPCNQSKGGKKYRGGGKVRQIDYRQYNLRLSKADLKRLQALSEQSDTSVSHEIRTAIKKHLKRKQ